MNVSQLNTQPIYYRLIALWVVCESMIGGIIHGFKLPFSGLIVGSAASVCICLIGRYVPVRGAILKATIIVAVFKLMLSPQAPPTAYIAVFFQGMIGQLIFSRFKNFRGACILLSVAALFESAVQRLLVLWIIYGNSFVKAFNDFLNKITGQKIITNYTLLLAVMYILFHIIFGFFTGSFVADLVEKSSTWKLKYSEELNLQSDAIGAQTKKNKTGSLKVVVMVIWFLLLLMFAYSLLYPSNSILPENAAFQIFIRSILIICGWYFFISPLLLKIIRKKLESYQSKRGKDVQMVMSLLPLTRNIVANCWKHSSDRKGLRRIKVWAKLVYIQIITPAENATPVS
ncbi:hypothetical protein BH09BAC2_BH09BAC2_13350 [soil metagenome]